MAPFADFVREYPSLITMLKTALFGHRSISLSRSSRNDSKKSASESTRLRVLGNESYSANEMGDAFMYYCKSVATAPVDSEELALAFGNRSALLFRIENFELCLLDINRALKMSCLPERSKPKLLKRKTDCWAHIQSLNKFKRSILEGREFILPNEPLDTSGKCFFQINEMSIDTSDFDCSSPDDPIWNTKFVNALLPNFSSKVKVEYRSTSKKHHWIATKDIKSGEILMIDNLFAVRTPEKVNRQYNHCAHCTVWCEALIPCTTCTLQMYCTERCRQEAYDSYHRSECQMLPLLSFDELQEDVLLALRMFLIGTEQGSKLSNLMNDSNVYESIRGNRHCGDVPYPNDYFAVLNLPWKIDNQHPFSEDITDDKLRVVAQMFSALRLVGFFRNENNDGQNSVACTDTELFSGLLLYHHVSLLRQWNIGLYAEYMGSEKLPGGAKLDVPIGSALSVFFPMTNHSCDPNVAILSKKRRQLTYSVRAIKADEEIFSCYGFSYTKRDRQFRREKLKEIFNMKCRCKPCVHNWPGRMALMRATNKYRTTNRRIINEIEKMHEWMLKLLLNATTVTTIYEVQASHMQKVFAFIEKMRQYLEEPSPIIFLCEEFAKQCMSKRGNCYSVMNTHSLLEYLRIFKI